MAGLAAELLTPVGLGVKIAIDDIVHMIVNHAVLQRLADAAGVSGSAIAWSIGAEGEMLAGTGGRAARIGQPWGSQSRVVVVWDCHGVSLGRQGKGMDWADDIVPFDRGRGIARVEHADRTWSWAAATAVLDGQLASCAGSSVAIHRMESLGCKATPPEVTVDLGVALCSVLSDGHRLLAAAPDGKVFSIVQGEGVLLAHGNGPLMGVDSVQGGPELVFRGGMRSRLDR